MGSTNNVRFLITNDAAMIFYSQGAEHGKSLTFPAGSAQYRDLLDVVKDDHNDAQVFLERVIEACDIGAWLAIYSNNRFSVSSDGHIVLDGKIRVRDSMHEHLCEMARNKINPEGMVNFYLRLAENPSPNSVDQLSRFLNSAGIPIMRDGTMLLYKRVRADFTDVHTGTLDNSVGKTVALPRHKVEDNPNQHCSFGLHAGNMDYVSDFGNQEDPIVIVRIDPADVVSVPNDASYGKIRVCKYTVVGIHGSSEELLDNTATFDDDDLPEHDHEPASEFLSEEQLADLNLSDLRKVARSVYKIVGASKVPGGRETLMKRIRKAAKDLESKKK